MENLAQQNEELHQQILARQTIPEENSRREDGGERVENHEEVINNGHLPPPFHNQENHLNAKLEDLKRKY